MMNPPPPCPGGFVYTVRPGDTLFSLARRFGLSPAALLAANPELDPAQNPGADPNRLFIGQQICIPAPPSAFCPGVVYTVAAGDTLFSLANRFNTTVEAILAANPGLDPERLFIGEKICIPLPAPPVCPGFTYVVRPGDTLFGLAKRFNTSVTAILAANPGIDPNRLQIGQEICLPAPAPPCPGFTYTVGPGETVFSLARRFGTSVEAILAANPGLVPEKLAVGQRICIPTRPRPAVEPHTPADYR